MTLPARMLSALLDPGALAEGAGSRAWADVLLIAILAVAAANFAMWNSAMGRRMFEEERQASIERMRGRVPDETLARIARAPAGYTQTALGAAFTRAMNIGVPVLIWTAAVHLLFSVVLLRQDVGFSKVLTIFSHGALIWAIAELLMLALTYTDGIARGSTSLVHLIPAVRWPPRATFAGALAARFDLFDLWWVPAVSLGLARVYGVKAWIVIAAIGGIRLALVVAGAALARAPEAGGAPFGHPI